VLGLVEYQTQEIPLGPTDLEYVLALVHGSDRDAEIRPLEAITPTPVPGRYRVRAGPFVGRLGLPSGATLDFQSRFPFDDVLELILQSGRRQSSLGSLRAEAGQRQFLVDALAAAFARDTARIVGGGLAKAYSTRRFLAPPYPGALDVNYHLTRLAGRPDRLAAIARRLTVDIPHNQALALALDVLNRTPLDAALRSRMSALGAAFTRVSRPPLSGSDVASIPLDRLTRHYEPALALAELIIRTQTIAPSSSEFGGASVLFYMPKVWEAYVARWVATQWPDHLVEHGWNFDLTTDGSLRAEADVVVWDGERVVALYDAKYKSADGAPSHDDLYQMVTYCERLDIHEATLVYPQTAASRSVEVNHRRINVVGVDPSENEASREAAGQASSS
jgi:5-methylcytosine-specific restriction endonuclease McrBC regulatory subunit McrC